MDNENITSGIPPNQTIEPIAQPAKSKPSFFLIILIIFLFFVTGISAYYFGTQQTKIKTNIIPTQNPTPTTISYPTQTITITDKFKIPLKENWKRITITNLGFAMQIPIEWKAGYCRNKLKKEFTTIEYIEGDNLFLASDSAEFNYPDCASEYRAFHKDIRLLSFDITYENYLKILINPNQDGLPRKIEYLTYNGLNIQVIHLNWCEGLKENEFNDECIPISGGSSKLVFVEIPKNNSFNNYDLLKFDFLVPSEMLKTIEFY